MNKDPVLTLARGKNRTLFSEFEGVVGISGRSDAIAIRVEIQIRVIVEFFVSYTYTIA